MADSAGFHVAGPVSHPADTAAVSAARLQHAQLYDAIAVRNSQLPVAPLVPEPAPAAPAPQETAAVANLRSSFHQQFEQIAAEHARWGQKKYIYTEENSFDVMSSSELRRSTRGWPSWSRGRGN